MIDTHSHVYDSAFDADRDEVVKRALEAGVNHFIMPAIDSSTHASMFSVAENYKNHYATMGVHPTSIKANYLEELELAKELLAEHGSKLVAIGEIGLDYYWDTTFAKEQVKALHTQLEWAIENNLPAIIHTREAWGDMLNVLSDYAGSSLRCVLHGFSGTPDVATKTLSYGEHMLGIGGVVTFKKSTLPDVVREVGLAYLLTETDAPYLAPTPHRGKRNESSYIALITQHIAEILALDFVDTDKITTFNAEKIFNLK